VAHKRQLTLIPLLEARAALLGAALPLTTREAVAVPDALGRITAELVSARASAPHYHAAAMDGIALRAADTAGASEAHPAHLELGTPATSARPFSYVDTGNALPAWADAVVMVERVFAGHGTHPRRAATTADRPAPEPSAADDDCCAPDDVATTAAASLTDLGAVAPLAGTAARLVHVRAAAAPWQHVRLVGEDVVASELLLPRGHEIRPYDVGALLAAGIVEVAVRPRPVVAILPTGDELIEPGEPRRPGRIVEFNSRMIAAFVREWGGEPRRLAPAGDNLDAIRSRVALALREADVVCVIAGSSAGEHDFTALALASLGEILAHGIALMPGKPAIVAAIPASDLPGAAATKARVALGIPGYPVSAAVICRELLEPLLAHLLGRSPADRPSVRATTPRRLAARPGQEELVRVTLGRVAGRLVLSPLGRGAGAITTMVRADGFVRLLPDVADVAAGAEVDVELLRPLNEVLGTIVVAGSHDPVLGLLEDALRAAAPGYKLAISSVGSRAGLLALARGEAHVAATHDAERDVAIVASAAAQPVVVHLLVRELGLIVAPGNPLGLDSVADLTRDDVRTPPEVRRSAVRFLKRTSESSRPASDSTSDGEEQELTPMAVAVAVQSGLADAGLGIASAAAALGLGFVPLAREDYDLVLRADFAASAMGRALLAAARSSAFRAAVAPLPGYDTSRSGVAK